MKLVWSPETALESYMDTIKSCDRFKQTGEAEFIAATAGGWNAQLIVEAWAPETSPAATSLGMSMAAKHTRGRHVCIVADEEAKGKYVAGVSVFGVEVGTEVVVGEAEEVVRGLEAVDFMVVDGRRGDLERVLRAVNVGQRSAVLVCRGVSGSRGKGFSWEGVLGEEARVVRSLVIPVGRGLDIAYVCYGKASKETKDRNQSHLSRWIKHVDEVSGEEHMFRRSWRSSWPRKELNS